MQNCLVNRKVTGIDPIEVVEGQGRQKPTPRSSDFVVCRLERGYGGPQFRILSCCRSLDFRE